MYDLPGVPLALREEWRQLETRRHFLGRMGKALGWAGLATLLGDRLLAAGAGAVGRDPLPGLPLRPDFAPRAKRCIYLFMSGAPPQMDLWDYKPGLGALFDTDLPDSIRSGQTLTGLTAGQARFPIAPSYWKFAQHGRSGRWVSELLPYTSLLVDDIAVVKSVYTDAINHEPAILLMNTGSMVPGKPAVGAWLSYGLGSMNDNLPTFVVLNSTFIKGASQQPISPRLWSSGFMPANHAGVMLRSQGDPVLYVSDPRGVARETRRVMIEGINEINADTFREVGDLRIHSRISQYEMAFRMQTSVPELADLSREPQSTWDLYGPEAKIPGSFAYNCLMARRLAERGVRFTQVYQRGWDVHSNVVGVLPKLCAATDRGCYALVTDLRRRGLLDDTLVVWGGEFGRTVYSQGGLSKENYGRDHHPRCFSVWMAGGGVKAGASHGETDDYSYNVVRDGVHLRDLNATILHLFGLNHEALTYRFQGLDQRLTGVDPARVVDALLG